MYIKKITLAAVCRIHCRKKEEEAGINKASVHGYKGSVPEVAREVNVRTVGGQEPSEKSQALASYPRSH